MTFCRSCEAALMFVIPKSMSPKIASLSLVWIVGKLWMLVMFLSAALVTLPLWWRSPLSRDPFLIALNQPNPQTSSNKQTYIHTLFGHFTLHQEILRDIVSFVGFLSTKQDQSWKKSRKTSVWNSSSFSQASMHITVRGHGHHGFSYHPHINFVFNSLVGWTSKIISKPRITGQLWWESTSHNEHDGVSNHQRPHCLRDRMFRPR